MNCFPIISHGSWQVDRRCETVFKAQSALFEVIMQTVPDGIWGLNMDFYFKYVKCLVVYLYQ